MTDVTQSPNYPKVVEVLKKHVKTGADIQPTSHLQDDLGADSLDSVEIVMELEEACDVTIEDDEAEGVKTVADLVNLVDAKKPAKAA